MMLRERIEAAARRRTFPQFELNAGSMRLGARIALELLLEEAEKRAYRHEAYANTILTTRDLKEIVVDLIRKLEGKE